MDLTVVLRTIIEPALALLPKQLDSPAARVELLAIGLQESGFLERRQYGGGPATGFWQFEQGGGVKGVYTHSSTTEMMRLLCRARDCAFEPRAIWAAFQTDDLLACGAARLLLYADRQPLPPVGDKDRAWGYYLRNWRPGKPRPETWPANYQAALAAVGV